MYGLIAVLIVFGAAMRVLPHEANVAPVAALALFGGVYLRPRLALVVPIAALVASDLLIGFDSLQSRAVVYGSVLVVSAIGLVVRRKKRVASILAGSLAGSLIFYLVTNFVFFYPPHMYTHDLAGMMQSYANALPFFRNSVLGDLLYTGLLFGVYELVLLMRAQLGASKGVVLPHRQDAF